MQRVDSGGGASAPPFLTVACVLQSGGVYTPDWVRQLKEGVDRHLSGHRFVCLSDVEVPCERIPLERTFPRYWCKMSLFRHVFDTPVLYIDLDSVIVGPLDDLFRGRLTMVQDFRYNGVANGSVMSWTGDHSHLWRWFITDPDRIMRAYDMRGSNGGLDQGFVSDHSQPHDFFPEGMVCSYKVHCKGAPPPPGARVVQFHGFPKQNQVTEEWL